ncbi:hypothetical protein [Streptomyces sp. NPDC085596]|uniref:hypothetical protein n=1 Tax=Streptomyces sp. NPDC085596 TaxID=3365731 RepID=UPI0037D48A67
MVAEGEKRRWKIRWGLSSGAWEKAGYQIKSMNKDAKFPAICAESPGSYGIALTVSAKPQVFLGCVGCSRNAVGPEAGRVVACGVWLTSKGAMPRRRPSALRGERAGRRYRRRFPLIDRLSGSCTAALRRLEWERCWGEDTEVAFWHWKALAHGPLRELEGAFEEYCGVSECGCYSFGFREHLEVVLHALPKKSARELRALVWALDEKILAKAYELMPGSSWARR